MSISVVTSGGDPAAISDSLLRTLIASSPLAIYVLDLEGRVRLWNPAAEQIFGWREAEVLGSPDPTVPSEQREEFGDLMRSVADGRPFVELELTRQGRIRRHLEIALSASCVSDSANRPVGVMVIAADITERRRIERERNALLGRERLARMEAEAAERRARFLAEAGALLDGSLDYGATLDNLAALAIQWMADYCLVDMIEGEQICRVALAHTDAKLDGILQRDTRQPLTDEPDEHPVLRVVLTGRPVMVEQVTDEVMASIAHDERHLFLLRETGLHSFLIVPLVASGKVLGAITLAYAGSRRRYTAPDLQMAEELGRRAGLAVHAAQLYRESRRAVEARERLLAIVSHDLRNALATVLLNVSAILDAPDSEHSGPVTEQLRWIAKSAEQMNRLIADLLDVSAIEQGHLSIEPSVQSAEGLVHDAIEMCRPLAAEKSIVLAAEADTELPYVQADGERLQQVLGNLLGNAVKFSPTGARVCVRVSSTPAGEVCFSVTDQGAGIEPEHQPAVFELYWRRDRSGRGGAGLGLAIARAIVEAHGGRIWVDSVPGEGSTFHFALSGLRGFREARTASHQES